jgi:glutaminyl-peptide cyclotransferase
LSLIAIAASIGSAPAATAVPEALKVRVVATYPHATDAYTQGLVWHGGKLYESTGLRGRSSLREVDLETGTVRRRQGLPDRFFAEGLARVGDRLIQLTWTSGKALVWDLERFQKIGEHDYGGEGWGLCHDGEQLVMSDGSATLTFRDPETFEARRRVRVTRLGRPVRDLNELECVEGSVWANVWRTERIVRIDPSSGEVTATVDASGLLKAEERRGTDVLNGIVWHPERERFLLTGKLWPKVFEVELVPQKE